MRYFPTMILMVVLQGVPGIAEAQQPPVPAAEPGDSVPDAQRPPAAPRPFVRRLVRRDLAPLGSAVRTPPEEPLSINGVATLGMMTGGIMGTFLQMGSDVAAVASSDALRVMPLVGRGSLQNLADLLNLRGVDLALVSADSARAAEANPAYSGLRSRVHYIAKLYNQEIHVLAGAYGVTLLVLSLALLPGAPVTKQGMGRRWIVALAGWGVTYAVSLVVGLTWLRESVLFWLLAAVVVTAPLAVGAWREGRA